MHYSKLTSLLIAGISLLLASPPANAKPLKVVATLSTFADIAETIGGDHVKVSYVASPKFNPHFISPRPSDVLRVKKSDLFIHAGLDLEAWRGPLVNAAGNPRVRPGGERELSIAEGIKLLNTPADITRAAGDLHIYGNPHYWVDPRNGLIIAETIAKKLSEIDPDHAFDYQANLDSFRTRLEAKISEWSTALEEIRGRELIAYHDAWPYLLKFAGLRAEVFLEPKAGIPPSPKHMVFLEQYIKENAISAIVQASYLTHGPPQKLSDRTGVPLLLLFQSVGEGKEANDYISMMDHNISTLLRTISSQDKE